MCRLFPLGVPALVAMVVLLLGTLSEGRPSEEGKQVAQPAARRSEASYLSLPGFWELRTEGVQKELELTDQQKDKLRAIGQEYYEQTRRDWTGFRGMSAGERKKKYAEIRQKNVERMKEIRKQVEKVLSPGQLERLKQINLRTRGAAALANPRVLSQLEVTESQKQRLRQIREQLQERIRKLQQETLEKTLGVLTSEQRKKLEDLTIEGFGIYGTQQASGTR